jgi:hypothetical protein
MVKVRRYFRASILRLVYTRVLGGQGSSRWVSRWPSTPDGDGDADEPILSLELASA